MLEIGKTVLRRSFLYAPLLQAKEASQIYLHDWQLLPIKIMRGYIRKRRFIQIENSSLPPVVHIEVTNTCNSRCAMCPQATIKRELAFMEGSLYQKIIKQCQSAEIVWLFMMGEPLMDKNLPQRITYAKNIGIKKIGIFTNASLLDLDLADKLLNSGIDSITISFEALNEQTFNEIRHGLNFHDITKNIKNLVMLRKKRKQKKPFIAIEFVKMKRNASETDSFRRKWGKIVDAVYIADIVNWGGANQIESTVWPYYKLRRPCYLLWKDMVIFVDGQVALCCYDYNGSVILGDTKRGSLEEIWAGEKLAKIRKMHLDGEFEKIPICANCNVWKMLSLPWWW